jgi:hypothetical protein
MDNLFKKPDGYKNTTTSQPKNIEKEKTTFDKILDNFIEAFKLYL